MELTLLQKIEIGVSSMISAIWYAAEGSSLYVRFANDAVYRVDNVSLEMRDQFVEEGQRIDGKVGKLYNKLIKCQPINFPAVQLSAEQIAKLGI